MNKMKVMTQAETVLFELECARQHREQKRLVSDFMNVGYTEQQAYSAVAQIEIYEGDYHI
jgi:hypothetical protein